MGRVAVLGYGGLDLAVDRVFAHHWPDAPKLGYITTIDWRDVPPVDILCGGFPYQDLSTAGKQAALAPGTRSGLWSLHGHGDRGAATVVRGDRERLRAALHTVGAVRNLP